MQKTEVYYQIAHSQLQQQYDDIRTMDTKAAGILALAAALGGVAALVLKSFSSDPKLEMSLATVAASICFCVFFILTCAFALLVLKTGSRRSDPDLEKFSSLLPYSSDKAMGEWAGDQLRNAVTANEDRLARKARWMNSGLLFICLLVLGLIALSITVYL